MTDYPPVTCLCLTRNRPKWLARAIRCYQAQTYPNKELLVAADGEDVAGIIVNANDPSIKYVHIAESWTIGAKRNHGSGHAKGEIIISWDDDDWNGPERITDQVSCLMITGKAVSCYHSMLFTDGRVWRKYNGHTRTNMGTTLCYMKTWWAANQFPERPKGEDAGFIKDAFRAGQLVSADAGLNMVASVHPGNTVRKKFNGPRWTQVERPQISGFEWI